MSCAPSLGKVSQEHKFRFLDTVPNKLDFLVLGGTVCIHSYESCKKKKSREINKLQMAIQIKKTECQYQCTVRKKNRRWLCHICKLKQHKIPELFV